MFPPSARWLAPPPSHLAESASTAPAPAALAFLGKLSAGWSLLMPHQQQQQQQGREGCGRLPTWQTAGRAAGRKLGPFSAHSLRETKPRWLDEQARQLRRGTSCPAWARGPYWPQTHWVTLGHLLLLSGPISPSASEHSRLDTPSSSKRFYQFSAENSGGRRGFTLRPQASPFPSQTLSLSVQQ